MIVFLNGKFVPEEAAVVSIFDRSFLYGDGLFETLLVERGVPFRWRQHLERLERGAAFLGISLPFTPDEMRGFAARLLLENAMPNALLRLSLSRGIGLRGYSPRGANLPFLVMTLHSTAGLEPHTVQSWNLKTASFRLPANEHLAQFKTCNKLTQILARAQAEEAGAGEALLLNTEGFVVEGATSNMFWTEQGWVYTPSLASGILSGVTRLVVLEVCRALGFEAHERNITCSQLVEAEGVFLSLSSAGIVEASSLDGHPLRQSPMTARIHRAYFELLDRETGDGARW
jgi:branched-chain amino acid aminotransferase